jgi:tight adherence protein B
MTTRSCNNHRRSRLIERRARRRRLCVLAALAVALALPASVAHGVSVVASAAPGDLTLSITSTDLSAYPQTSAVVQLGGPLAARLGTLSGDAFSVKVDGAPVQAEVTEAAPGTVLPVQTALLIDESGSMKGEATRAAAAAAQRFLEAMRSGDTAAVQAFNEGFRTLHDFTGEQGPLSDSLGGLSPQKETALYDALLKSLASFRTNTEPGSRYVVLLSDGGDTASVATLDDVVAAVRSSSIQVYTIGLKTEEFDSQPLASIAAASGGRYLETPDPAALTDLYETLAREIHNQYLLTFAAAPNASGAGRLLVEVIAGGAVAQAEQGFFYPGSATTTSGVVSPTTTVVPANAGTVTPAGPSLTSRFLDWGGSDYTVGLVLFVIVFALLYLISGILFPKRDVLKEYGDVLDNRRDLGPRAADETGASTGLAQRATRRLLAVRGYEHPLQRLIDDAGLKFRASEFALLHLIGAVVIAVVVRLVGGSLLVVVVALILVVIGPLLYLQRKGETRRRAFEAQVPNTLALLAGSLRAGQGFEQAITVAATEAPEPTAVELRRVLAQQRLGVAPEDALRDIAERMRSEAFEWVVMATVIQRQVGGNLAEVYESIAATLRERAKMKRQTGVLTAEVRLSAVILVLLPFGVAAAMGLMNREYLSLLWQTTAGQAMIGVALALIIIGILWLRKIARVDT